MTLADWVKTATFAQLNTRKDHFQMGTNVSEFLDGRGSNIATMAFDSVLTHDEKGWKVSREFSCARLRI